MTIRIHHITEGWAYFVEHPNSQPKNPVVGVLPIAVFNGKPIIDELYELNLRRI